MVCDAVADSRVDGVFGDIALDAEIVVVPMAWLSDAIIEKAPRSCKISSAAMVSLRMRLSAKATSSGMRASR
jgi:hypothetical protein